jgi:hypothetical protein
MFRVMMVAGLMLAAVSSPVLAGQTSAQFRVGITIGGGSASQPSAAATTTYTWGAAAISVSGAGFGNPVRLEKSNDLHWFQAERDGGTYRVAVSTTSGAVVKVIPA